VTGNGWLIFLIATSTIIIIWLGNALSDLIINAKKYKKLKPQLDKIESSRKELGKERALFGREN